MLASLVLILRYVIYICYCSGLRICVSHLMHLGRLFCYRQLQRNTGVTPELFHQLVQQTHTPIFSYHLLDFCNFFS